MREQDAWDEHAAFMDALVDEGYIVFGGPIGKSGTTLVVVDVESPDGIEARFDADPWTKMGLLRMTRIEPWLILLGDVPR